MTEKKKSTRTGETPGRSAKQSSEKTSKSKSVKKASAESAAKDKAKAKASAKAAAKASAKAKVKAKAEAKAKPAAKAKAKASVKPAAKSTAKPAVKPAAKAKAKPTAKPAVKPAAKPAAAAKAKAGTAAKSAAKGAAKSTAKPAPKSTAKTATKKSTAAPAAARKPSGAAKPAAADAAKPQSGASSAPTEGAAKKKIPPRVFKVGQLVVYPLQGVGKIEAIESRKFQGKQVDYYVIRLESSDMTIITPTYMSGEVGIRKLISAKEAGSVFDVPLNDSVLSSTLDWKMRYQHSLQEVRAGDVINIASVLRLLYLRSKIKDLPILERKLYDSSLQALVYELSVVLKKPDDMIRTMLMDKFEEPIAKP